MWKDDSATVRQKRVFERDRWIEVLPDENIAMIECCSDYFEEELVRFRDRSFNVIQSKSVITLGGGNGYRFWHGRDAIWIKATSCRKRGR